ncbi:MAG: ATP-binding cassette domain-containing protein [Gemmatimonadales bacterium]|nr:MAG: ATP-binding cassette domain-containing protein [Gemmatimonadales bacterium]
MVIRDLHKAFGTKEVLRGFSVEATEGETLVILGQSGSGKSVTLKHVVGLLEPDQGLVEVDGLEVSTLSREELYDLRRRAGYVFQFAALFDSLTVAENVGMGLRRMKDVGEEERRSRVEECLALVDLDGFGDRMPAELSGGQRKRAGIARAIATRPKYLLYDEPTTGLDPITRAVIDRLINRMKEELGVTGLVITHDMESAFRVADSIAMLYEGTCRFHGTVDEIRDTDDPVVRAFIEGRPELIEEAL